MSDVARAMVLRGLFASTNAQSVVFRVDGVDTVDDFSDGWRQLTPQAREGWQRAARLIAACPQGLLVVEPPGAYADTELSPDGRRHGGGVS